MQMVAPILFFSAAIEAGGGANYLKYIFEQKIWKKGGANRCRVCYQRGLPCLVFFQCLFVLLTSDVKITRQCTSDEQTIKVRPGCC